MPLWGTLDTPWTVSVSWHLITTPRSKGIDAFESTTVLIMHMDSKCHHPLPRHSPRLSSPHLIVRGWKEAALAHNWHSCFMISIHKALWSAWNSGTMNWSMKFVDSSTPTAHWYQNRLLRTLGADIRLAKLHSAMGGGKKGVFFTIISLKACQAPYVR